MNTEIPLDAYFVLTSGIGVIVITMAGAASADKIGMMTTLDFTSSTVLGKSAKIWVKLGGN